MRLRTRVASATLALSMLFGSGVAVMAAPRQGVAGGAAGLVAAVVQALNNVNVDVSNVDVTVVQVDDSLNNLTALNNILNNSPFLNDVTVIIGDISVLSNILNIDQLYVLNNSPIDVLNNSPIDVNAIIGVVVLGGQDLILLTR